MATHSTIIARKIPWAEEPGRLQSMGSRRVGHDWSDLAAAAAAAGLWLLPLGNFQISSSTTLYFRKSRERCFSYLNNPSRLEVSKTENGKKWCSWQVRDGNNSLAFCPLLVGKDTHSDVVLNCLQPKSYCQELMICSPKKDGCQGGPK